LSSIDRQIIMLKNRFSKMRDDQRSGIIDDKDARLELNRINHALLDLAESIPSKSTKNTAAKISSTKEKKPKTLLWGILAGGALVLIGLVWFFNTSRSSEINPQDNNLPSSTDSSELVKKEAEKKQLEYNLLLHQADSLYEAKNYEKAKQLYNQLSGLDIQNKELISKKLKSCQDEIMINRLLKQGKEEESKNQFKKALNKYEAALSIKPKDELLISAKNRVTAILNKPKLKPWEEKFIGKYLVLKDVSSKKIMTVNSTNNATELHLDKYKNSAYQYFRLVSLGNGLYAFESKLRSSQILTTSRTNYNSDLGYSKPGPLWIYQWAAGNKKPGGNQTWKLKHKGGNKFQIQNNHSELYIGESKGKIFQLPKGESEVWEFYLEGDRIK
ncbi:MAG: hypothetical protein AB8F74_12200, partial [Saprospiraceae bacterium]